MQAVYRNTRKLSLCKSVVNFRVQRLEKEEQKALCVMSSKQSCGKQ